MIKTPFGFSSTAAEVAQGIDLTGRRIVVTGASSGIGVETARALADAGAEVTLAVRDTAAGEKAGIGRVAQLDLTDLASIDAFTASWRGPLHVLINNAGVMATPSSTPSRAGSGSSRPTTSATSRWPPACTTRSRRKARASSWSAPPGTCSRR